jgi:putative flippase GtrA
MDICIISNTRHPERLDRLATKLDICYKHHWRFKPSRHMFKQALAEYKVEPKQAVMIGDQLFTDVLGANRSGVDAIWVKQMAPVDFALTKVSRMGERILRKRLYRKIQQLEGTEEPVDEGEEEDLPLGGTAAFELLQNPVVRQFVKFCIVGGSSTVIDLGLLWVMMFYLRSGDELLSQVVGSYLVQHYPMLFGSYAAKPPDAAVPVFKILTSGLAIFNAFVWNRRWTFKIRGKEHRSVQMQKFFAVAIVGMVLNTIITTIVNSNLPGAPKTRLLIAMIVATVLVTFWNFFGQKHWTFKGHAKH